MKKIAIITGGYSAEAEISRKSAQTVKKHLDTKKYISTVIDVFSDRWEIDGEFFEKDRIQEFDAVFMALHGTPAEDGKIQLILDKLEIPYSCCDSSVSWKTFNKSTCNKELRNHGFRCPESITYKKGDLIDKTTILNSIGLPCFVKPNASGSSYGISKVKNISELDESIRIALEHDRTVLIEEFIDGTEVSCGVFLNKQNIIPLPITEIISENEFFDYEAKYEGKSKEITPANISVTLKEEIQRTTVELYKKMKLRGLCRIDFIIKKEIPYIIEINTIPGLSNESIIPQQIREAGYNLKEVFEICLEN